MEAITRFLVGTPLGCFLGLIETILLAPVHSVAAISCSTAGRVVVTGPVGSPSISL